ncbi:MAG: hypothetical protein QXZ44_04600 [Ferroplasma sp.]
MKEFPKFHCCITQKDEEYDSEVQLYFSKENELAGIIANLSKIDKDYEKLYLKIFDFIKSLENFIIMGEKAQDFEFMKGVPADKGEIDDYAILLSNNRAAKIAFRGGTKTIELMYYYRSLSRNESYSYRFIPENFEFLQILHDVLYHRASELIKS